MRIKIGCCGFPIRKEEYYKEFNVVEIQQTFYQPPEKIETIEKWRESAPSSFEFTLKVWQLITHPTSSPTYRRLKIKIPENKKKNYGNFKPSDEVFSTWNRMDEIAEVLGSRVILFQCPGSFLPTKENKENMKEFFKTIDRKNYIFVWEPRGEWEENEIRKICEELNLVHCVDPLKNKSVYGDIRYYRLHGVTGYNYRYKKDELIQIKRLIDEERLEAYIMFNNTNMFQDAKKTKKLLT